MESSIVSMQHDRFTNNDQIKDPRVYNTEVPKKEEGTLPNGRSISLSDANFFDET